MISLPSPELSAVLVLILAVLGVFVHAILRRIVERVAVWVLPEDQALSFRLAWLLVRLTERLAPKVRCYWGGWTSSGPSYSVSPFQWQAPEEARADLEAALQAKERVVAPVRLVLPLVAEATRLQARNGWNRMRRWISVGPFIVLIFTLLPVLSALGWIWEYGEWLLDRLRRKRGQLRKGSR